MVHRPAPLVLAVLAACTRPPSPSEEAPRGLLKLDPDGREAVLLLRDLIRFDTVNPPLPGSGRPHANETALLEHVRRLLAAEGIASDIYESVPGRGNLVARFRGTGEKRPVLLMAHVDVVGFDRALWEVDPLAGVIRDGFLWGRGALDDKDDAAVFIQVLRILARTRARLKRDVLLMLNADEESSGRYGARFMVERHPDVIDCEFALNEGGRAVLRGDAVVQYGIQTAEKVYHDIRLFVRGPSGHSSVPLPDNAIVRLGRMLEKLDRFRLPARVLDTVAAQLRGLANTPEMAPWRDALKRAAAGDPASVEDLCREPRFNALLRSTVVPTIVRGGIRENVLPPDAEVNLNARLLPGDRIDDVLRRLMEHLEVARWARVEGGPEAVERWKRENREADVAIYLQERGVDAPASPLDTEMYRTLESVARRLSPGALVVPQLTTGATDARFLRLKGVPCYGINPCPTGQDEEGTLHGHNERVRLTSVAFGVRFVKEVLLEIAR